MDYWIYEWQSCSFIGPHTIWCVHLLPADESSDKVWGFQYCHQENIDKHPLENVSKKGFKWPPYTRSMGWKAKKKVITLIFEVYAGSSKKCRKFYIILRFNLVFLMLPHQKNNFFYFISELFLSNEKYQYLKLDVFIPGFYFSAENGMLSK